MLSARAMKIGDEGGRVLSTQYSVLSTQYTVVSSKSSTADNCVLGTRYLFPLVPHLTFGSHDFDHPLASRRLRSSRLASFNSAAHFSR